MVEEIKEEPEVVEDKKDKPEIVEEDKKDKPEIIEEDKKDKPEIIEEDKKDKEDKPEIIEEKEDKPETITEEAKVTETTDKEVEDEDDGLEFMEVLLDDNKSEEEVETIAIQPKDRAGIKGKRYEELKGFYFIKESVIDLIRALQYGPVVVAHYVSEPFKFYSTGVFDGDGCENGTIDYVNHASVIVGYDLDDKMPYFKFRNSWADDWGEDGYYRIKIGELTKENKGTCLVAGTPFMVLPHLIRR